MKGSWANDDYGADVPLSVGDSSYLVSSTPLFSVPTSPSDTPWSSSNGPSKEYLSRQKIPLRRPFDYNPPDCPNPRMDRHTDKITGEIIEVPRYYYNSTLKMHARQRCRSNSCPSCCIWNARRLCGAIKLSDPDIAFTATLIGSHYLEIMKNIRKLGGRVRHFDPEFQYCWFAESNEQDTGNHAHFLAHTTKIKEIDTLIQGSWQHRTYCKVLKPNTVVAYFDYPMKCLTDDVKRGEFLDLNGLPNRRQLVHASNGFWRDGKNGPNLTRRAAEVMALRWPAPCI